MLRFDHHQIRDVVYEELSQLLREEYHGLVADALEADLQGRIRCAYGPHHARMINFLRSSAWRHEQRGDYDTAIARLRDMREAFVGKIRDENAEARRRHTAKDSAARAVSLNEARENRVQVDWSTWTPTVPAAPGPQVFDDYPLAELRDAQQAFIGKRHTGNIVVVP